MLFGLVLALLLQDLPGMPGMQVPITDVHREGSYLVGKAQTLDGKPVQKVYLINGKLREPARFQDERQRYALQQPVGDSLTRIVKGRRSAPH